MIKIYFKTVLLIPFLTACASTMDMKIPLSEEFENSSDVFIIETPTWRVPDTVYDKNIAGYSVVNTKTSFDSSKEQLIAKEEKENLINFLIFNDKDYYLNIEVYEVVSVREFSFNIKNNTSILSSAHCSVTSISIDEREEEEEGISFSSNMSVYNRGDRLSTYLSCNINDKDSSWNFSLASNENRTVSLKFVSDDESMNVKGISDVVLFVEDEKGSINKITNEEGYYPSHLALNSGLEFFSLTEQVSAISFVGKPRIWLKKGLLEDKKQLLLTVSYSLLMFDWLDSAWR
jgi:hypothetical protein